MLCEFVLFFVVHKKALFFRDSFFLRAHYFPVILFIMLYKVVLTLRLWIKSLSMTNETNATEQHFPMALLIAIYKLVLAFSLWMKSLSMAKMK